MTAPLPEGLQQAADYIKTRQLQLAQPLLVQYIKQQPDSADAWYLMSFIVADQRQQIDCLQRVLRFNPAHRQAQARLVEVMTAPPAGAAGEAAPVFTHTVASVRHDEEVQRDEVARLDRHETASGATPQPQSIPAPIEPEPEPAPSEPHFAEFTDLRSQLAEPVQERRKPRVLLFLLIFIVLVAAAGTTVVVLGRLRDESAAANDAAATQAALAVPPTTTPTATPSPTRTPKRFPPTWTPTVPPTALPTRTPTPLPTAEAAQDAQLRLVQQAIAALRGRAGPAADLSKRYIIQPDQVEPVLRNILSGNGVLNALPDRARVLSALGLIKPTYNLERYTLNMHLDPAGGFYSPWTHEMFVVANQATGVQSWAFALEAARALLDQSFEFDNTGAYPVCAPNGTQQCQAVRASIAGDAALTVQQWLRQSASAQDRSEVQSFKAPVLSLADDLAPAFVIRDVNFASEAGTAFAQYLFQRGGWTRLNATQTDLPQSTEQIMHPEKYIAGEPPIELTAVPPLTATTLGPGWQLSGDDVLGEWYTYLLLSANVDESLRVPDEAARSAARGWGGDRLQAYYNAATDETLLAVAWTWDTIADAREFKQTLSAHLDLRFGAPQASGDCWQASQQAACLYTRDKNTLWLLAPDQPLIKAMAAAYTPFP